MRQILGQYLPDNSTTVQTDYTVSLGLANPDFHRSLEVFGRDREHFSPELSIRAWINPDSEPDVTYVRGEFEPPVVEEESSITNDRPA